jgi:hypothetical protein
MDFPTLSQPSEFVFLVPVSDADHAAVSNYRPISIQKISPSCLNLLFTINASHGFSKSKFTVANSVTFLDFMTPVVRIQRQADAVYFDLSKAFDLSPITCSCLS